ncbi:MAG: formylglycine-generating enzyme family protein [Mariniblastus sp.]
MKQLLFVLLAIMFSIGQTCNESDVLGQAVKDAVASKTKSKQDRLGIVSEKPAGKPFVKIDGGYMVPYTATIPGTEIKYTMIPIQGGKFTMGSSDDEDDRRDDEGPQFEVTVEPFWMGKYEVTWAEYKRYMRLYPEFQALKRFGKRMVTAENVVDAVTSPSPLYDETHTFAEGESDEEPAATMTQYAAKQYTKWLSKISQDFYRLPTEAEWEYACRAGTTTAYYFGDDADDLEDHGWFSENSDDARQEVGLFPPNPWGLYDMHGNVAEWVLDQYHEDGYTHVEAGASVTTEKAYRRPTKVYPRVVRGGSFELEPEDCRSAARLGSEDKDWKYEDPNIPKSPWWYTDTPAKGVGFRLMRPLKVPATPEAKNAFWKPDVDSILENAKGRIAAKGLGAYGIVDENLPKEAAEAMAKQAEEDKNRK